MLFGGFDHKIDKKGRVFIPSTFREDLGEQFMICRYVLGNKYCLCIYSKEQWENFVKKIDTLPSTKSSAVKRFLYDGTFTIEFDTQGRILIPPVLRDYAKLGSEVHIVGMGNNLEIWDSELWKEENSNNTLEFVSSVMEDLADNYDF